MTPRSLTRWGALVITDRRWTAPLVGMAIGFGLFIGVAVGPGSDITLATGPAQIVEVLPGPEEPPPAAAAPPSRGDSASPPEGGGGGAGLGAPVAPLAPVAPAPVASAPPPPAEEPPPPVEEEAPSPTPIDEEQEEEAETLAGTVLQVNTAAESYALAAAGDEVFAIHAKKLPDPGTEIEVTTRALANGTLAEDGKREELGRSTADTLNGVVTFVDADPVDPAYTVSRLGVSALIHVRPDASGAPPPLPQVGEFATVRVEVEDAPIEAEAATDDAYEVEAAPTACEAQALEQEPAIDPETELVQQRLEVEGEPFTYSDFAGIVSAVCAEEQRLLVSADDIGSSGEDLSFSVPEGIALGKLELGESVAVTANLGEGGSLELAGIASDEGLEGADNEKLLQGDLAR